MGFQATNFLSEKERRQVAKAMCHNPETAERFYVALPDKEASYRTRVLRIKALQLATDQEDQPRQQQDAEEPVLARTPSTSSDSDEPILDDEPDTSLPLSLEELRVFQLLVFLVNS